MASPDYITTLIAEHGIAILTLLALLEGPVVTVIGAWLASLGLLNLKAVLFCVILADLVGDCIVYAAGRWLPGHVSPRFAARFGLTRTRMARLTRAFRDKGVKLIVLGKLTHAAGFAVLLAAGMAKMPFTRFFAANLLATLPKSLILALIGYLFGAAYERISGGIFLFSLVAVVALGIWIWVSMIRKPARSWL